MKKICYILLFFGLVLLFTGLSLKGLKANASQNILNRYTYDHTLGTNTVFLFQLPNNSNVIENDDRNYSVLSIGFDNNTNFSDFLLAKRIGTDSFKLYGYYGTDLQTTVTAYDFIGVYIYLNPNVSPGVFFMNIYQMRFNSSTQKLEIIKTMMGSVDIGAVDYQKIIRIRGITLGTYEFGGQMATDSAVTSYINNYIAPNLSDIVDDVSAQAYNRGYGNGYDQGYSDGQQGESAVTSVWTLIGGIFTTLGAIFSIELFPHIPLGVFILVPLFFGIVGLILWIWRRN